MKNNLRIIGGKWRSRKISFPDVHGLRPSTDRIRETVFNWLAPHLQSAVCLDLFAGSGAFGFESLSRGARLAVMVDQSQKVINQLKKNATVLNTENVEILNLKIPKELNRLPNYKFNILFLDPPFNKNLIKICCDWLDTSNIMAEKALVYIETETALEIKKAIPENWKILRSEKTKHVRYHLCSK